MHDAATEARAILRRLAACRRFESTVIDHRAGATWWVRGTLTPEPAGGDGEDGLVLVLREEGVREPAVRGVGRSLNRVRWTAAGPGLLVLEHLRHAARRIAAFRREGGGWVSDPHECGRDSYAPTLEVGAGGVVLGWRIRGPAKLASVTQRMPAGPRAV